MTSETTPQGSITYGYDLAGRRSSMTVSGQSQVTYGYDDANRLTQISQGTATVGFSYDDANRRSTLTLSNGVNLTYSYDNDSRVTGITYKFNAATLGDLGYSYDSLGRRTQVPLTAFRKTSQFSNKIFESRCPGCGLLIGASPHTKVLAALESIHTCPVYFRYGGEAEPENPAARMLRRTSKASRRAKKQH